MKKNMTKGYIHEPADFFMFLLIQKKNSQNDKEETIEEATGLFEQVRKVV